VPSQPREISVTVELDAAPQPVSVRLTAPDAEVRLSDVVPAARLVATQLARSARSHVESGGIAVPCAKGCAACCRYLVPLSVPEAFRLREEVLALDAGRRRGIIAAYIRAARVVMNAEPPGTHPREGVGAVSGGAAVESLSRWYAGLGLDCPLLEAELCALYSQRPIACREHMVTGDADRCSREGGETAQAVRLPFSVGEALAGLAADLEGTDLQAVMLPLTMLWTQQHLSRGRRTWPARDVLRRFAEILERKSAEARCSGARVA
jgi:Fe-S-cluster containining protein